MMLHTTSYVPSEGQSSFRWLIFILFWPAFIVSTEEVIHPTVALHHDLEAVELGYATELRDAVELSDARQLRNDLAK